MAEDLTPRDDDVRAEIVPEDEPVRSSPPARAEAPAEPVTADAPPYQSRFQLVFGVLLGVAAGLAGALALSRAIASLLFALSPTDPLTLGGTAVLLSAVALVASYLPARRATRVDPLIALRSE